MRPLPLAALLSLLAIPVAAAPPPVDEDARALLDRWEAAARTHLPVTEAERLRLRYDASDRPGQELELTCELQGPIDAADLARRYDWTVTERADDIELTAVPRDRLEGLFYESFSVSLRPDTCRPTAVRFRTTGGEVGPAVALAPWIDETTEAAGAIKYVGFETQDAPERPIRTADLSDEAPRLLREDAPLVLPPAPSRLVTPLEPVEAPRPLPSNEPAALSDVLEKFDRNYASAKRVRLKLFRWRYDNSFGIEKRDWADVWLEGRERGSVEFQAAQVEPGAVSDARLVLIPSKPDGWRWDPDRVTHYDPTSATYEVFHRLEKPLSPTQEGWPSSLLWKPERVLPVWSEPSAEALRARFDLTLLEVKDHRVYVRAKPRTSSEALFLRQLDIIFDSDTGDPLATRAVDPTVNGAVVLSARRIELNGPRPPVMALKNPIGAERAVR